MHRAGVGLSLATENVIPASDRAGLHESLALARLAAGGDTRAASRLLQRVAPAMLRVVRGVMGPYASDIDDTLQQSLIALIQALPAFRGECDPAGYASRIAFRTALAARKRARTQKSRHDDGAEAEALPGGGLPSDDSEARRRTDLWRALLDEIPEEQAEALTMRSVLGWSIEEIAAASQAPENTIRSRLRLAKEAIKKKIAADPTIAEELGVEP